MADTKPEQYAALNVRITNATSTLWEGTAKSVSSENTDGPFDILGRHANFITLVKEKPVVVTLMNGEKNTYDFRQAVIYVQENGVKIYGDFA
jgi:F0F1-type ATP synthase epsilon subunit